MAFSKALYFTALIPPQQVREEVLRFKLEIKEKFKAAHALKLPAHITLTPPVWLNEDMEEEFLSNLKIFAEAQISIPVALKDFGHFGQRVIFVKVEDHEPIKQLHAKISDSLSAFLPSTSRNIHPHITLASRDLKRENFPLAWKEFRQRSYSNLFTAEALFLFKHNGKTWDIIQEAPFLR